MCARKWKLQGVAIASLVAAFAAVPSSYAEVPVKDGAQSAAMQAEKKHADVHGQQCSRWQGFFGPGGKRFPRHIRHCEKWCGGVAWLRQERRRAGQGDQVGGKRERRH